jgi:N-methylhydantoinase A
VEKPALSRLPAQGRPVSRAVTGRRPVNFDAKGRHEALVYERARLDPGVTIDGPAIVEEPETSTVIGPGQRARIDDYGNICILLDGAAERERP